MSTSTSSNVDINTRYQRLATEYSRLRSQLMVLKDAVRDERQKNAESNEQTQGTERKCRRLEGEVESLTFRNAQLVKRVEQLQADSVPLKSKHSNKQQHLRGGAGGMPRSQSMMPTLSSVDPQALQDDLEMKLTENQQLHNKIFNLEQRHAQQMETLNAQLIQAREEVEQFKRSGATTTVNGAICRRATDHSCLDSNPFEDDSSADLQHIDIAPPRSTTISDEKRAQILEEHDRLMKLLSVGFSNFFKFTIERSQRYPLDMSMQPISVENEKYIEALQLCQTHAEAMFDVLRRGVAIEDSNFCDNLDGDRQFLVLLAQKLVDFTRGCVDLVPYFDASLSEECSTSWCTAQLNDVNQRWRTQLTTFLSQTCQDLNNWAVQLTNLDMTMFTHEQLTVRLHSVTMAMQNLHLSFSSKLSIEQRLPIATKQFRATNECLLASLNALHRQLLDCETLLNTAAPMVLQWCDGLGTKLDEKETNVNVVEEKIVDNETGHDSMNDVARTNGILDNVVGEQGDSLSAAQSLPPSKQSAITCEVVSLRRECTQLNDALMLSREQLREQGAQLESLREQLALCKLQPTSHIPQQQEVTESTAAVHSSISQEHSTSLIMDESIDYYRNRVQQLFQELQCTKSQYSYVCNELQNLVECLTVSDEAKRMYNDKYNAAESDITRLKEDLESTRHGYEQQLASLSEHMAGMNQQIATQSDQIDSLKHHRKGANGEKRGTNLASLFSKSPKRE